MSDDSLQGIEEEDRGALSLLIDPDCVLTPETVSLPTGVTSPASKTPIINHAEAEDEKAELGEGEEVEETPMVAINLDTIAEPEVLLGSLLLKDDELAYQGHEARVMKSGWIESDRDSFPDCECWLLSLGLKRPSLDLVTVTREPNPRPVSLADLKRLHLASQPRFAPSALSPHLTARSSKTPVKSPSHRPQSFISPRVREFPKPLLLPSSSPPPSTSPTSPSPSLSPSPSSSPAVLPPLSPLPTEPPVSPVPFPSHDTDGDWGLTPSPCAGTVSSQRDTFGCFPSDEETQSVPVVLPSPRSLPLRTLCTPQALSPDLLPSSESSALSTQGIPPTRLLTASSQESPPRLLTARQRREKRAREGAAVVPSETSAEHSGIKRARGPESPPEPPLPLPLPLLPGPEGPPRVPAATLSSPANRRPVQEAGASSPSPIDPVIVGSGLSADMQAKIQILCKKIGGVFVTEFSERVTHLVTPRIHGKPLAKRTVKYLSAVVGLCWIVSYEWIIESFVQKSWVPEQAFEIQGDSSIPHNAVVPTLSFRASFSRRLFQDLHVHLLSSFQDPPAHEIAAIIRHGGGTLIKSEEDLFSRDYLRAQSLLASSPIRVVVLSSPADDNQAYYQRTRICPLGLRWLFDTISLYSFDLAERDYRLVTPSASADLEDQHSLAY